MIPARATVLDYVRENPGTTAAAISRATDLALGVVLAQLAALRESAVVRVEEVGSGEVRKRRRYHLIGATS